jgi:hypothetical protein
VAIALFATHMARIGETFQTIAEQRDRSVQERVGGLARAALASYATNPGAHRFVLGHQARFLSALPATSPTPSGSSTAWSPKVSGTQRSSPDRSAC